jgi:undecaprenyl-diphosphatase
MHSFPLMISQIDAAWMVAFHSVTNPVLDWAAWLISTISWAGACWWVLAAVLWVRGYRLLAAQVVVALVIGAVSVEVLKHLLHRLRPSELMPQFLHLALPNLYDSRWSFPSGHSTLAMAAAMAVVFSTHKRSAWLLVIAALLVGWARIYQGVHWPSDVIAGWIIGIIAGLVAVLVSVIFEKNALFSQQKIGYTSRSRRRTTSFSDF